MVSTTPKNAKKNKGSGPILFKWVLIFLFSVFLFWAGDFLSMISDLPDSGQFPNDWLRETELTPTWILRNSLVARMTDMGKEALGVSIRQDIIEERSNRKLLEEKVPGSVLLMKGIEAALVELMGCRGVEEVAALKTPNFTHAQNFFLETKSRLSTTYDGTDDAVEDDYFHAMHNLALLELYKGDCQMVDVILDEADRVVDMNREEKAAVVLLRGYCFESMKNIEAGMYFELARDYTPIVTEHFLDPTYQPSQYQNDYIPSYEYFPTMMDLHIFRELYLQKMVLAQKLSTSISSINGTTITTHQEPWSTETSLEGDTYGANVGWGFNEKGMKRANGLFEENDFALLRDILHPYELAVLKRYYTSKVVKENIKYDSFLGRAVSYNDRVGMYLNQRYTQLMGEVLGRKVKHAYSFLCHYEKRAKASTPVLKPHTDREDNKYTVSIQIYSDKEHPLWPLYVDTSSTVPEKSSWRDMPENENVIECGVRNGDALLFTGRRHIHYRKEMPDELTLVASLLLHFVDESFDFFDYKLVRQQQDPSI